MEYNEITPEMWDAYKSYKGSNWETTYNHITIVASDSSVPDPHVIRSRPTYTTAAADALREKLLEAKRERPEVFSDKESGRDYNVRVTTRRGKRVTTGIRRTIWQVGPGVAVIETGENELVCNCVNFQKKKMGQLQMCTHVQTVFDEEKDGSDLPVIGIVKVPVFRNPGVMVDVQLESPNKLGMQAVLLPCDNFQHLGFIQLGQGRKSLRTLILEWAGSYDFGELECTAPQHMGDTNLVDGSRERVARLADICMWHMSDGACTLCIQTNGVPDL